jgi:hypothetical protein
MRRFPANYIPMHSKVTAVAIFYCWTGNLNDGHKGQRRRGRKTKWLGRQGLAALAATDGGSARQTLLGSNMPGGDKFAGGRRWPPVVIGGRWRTVFGSVHH